MLNEKLNKLINESSMEEFREEFLNLKGKEDYELYIGLKAQIDSVRNYYPIETKEAYMEWKEANYFLLEEKYNYLGHYLAQCYLYDYDYDLAYN